LSTGWRGATIGPERDLAKVRDVVRENDTGKRGRQSGLSGLDGGERVEDGVERCAPG
jgi:hypothetical protein